MVDFAGLFAFLKTSAFFFFSAARLFLKSSVKASEFSSLSARIFEHVRVLVDTWLAAFLTE